MAPYDSSKCDMCDTDHEFQLIIFTDDALDIGAFQISLCPIHAHMLGEQIGNIVREEGRRHHKEVGFV